MSHRREQRESTLLRAFQEVLGRGLSDPRIRGLITVTKVLLTEDSRQAFVSVSVLPADRAELTMHGLHAATAHIRRDVMKKVRMKEMPSVEFRYDDSSLRQGEVLGAINRAVEERGLRAVEPDGPDANDEGGARADAEGPGTEDTDVEA
ncbi:MAG: 30S ribosome-binding factor RbfA [Phycisphaeraceae bacterium]|nr:MAG: 30S ribosome-binding factor RbfA [Phycisphaeraceae bacterium]